MKKALLSLAVVAASSVYVVYQTHANSLSAANTDSAVVLPAPASQPLPAKMGDAAAPGSAMDANGTAATNQATANVFSVPAVPAAAAVSDPKPTVEVADVPPAQIASPAATAAVAPAVPPLPLPRPADAPTGNDIAQATTPQSGYRDGSYAGDSANAYYGRVQVDAVIQGGQLVTVKILDYPSDRRTSRTINSRALPRLEREAIQAQSAQIDAVSGATLTSEAFAESLDAALAQAHGGAGGAGNNA